jgi:hypothetical protein
MATSAHDTVHLAHGGGADESAMVVGRSGLPGR